MGLFRRQTTCCHQWKEQTRCLVKEYTVFDGTKYTKGAMTIIALRCSECGELTTRNLEGTHVLPNSRVIDASELQNTMPQEGQKKPPLS